MFEQIVVGVFAEQVFLLTSSTSCLNTFFINSLNSLKVLKSRQLSIEISNLRSQYFGAKAGLPQGSVLSPILFIFFVSDMFKNLNGKTFKFADDGNLLVTGETETQLHLNSNYSQTTGTVVQKLADRSQWRQEVNHLPQI